MYFYETHLHTSPVSRCALAYAAPESCLRFYREQGYDGVFITNHFLDGNINIGDDASYEERIEFYFSDYERARSLADGMGIKVFLGIETSYHGTDFLVYGLDKQWFLAHPECMSMRKTEQLALFAEYGALIIQAHPYREAPYIDHIRLFPRHIHGVEVINASRTDFENSMAESFANSYSLLKIAGSDNHWGAYAKRLAGIFTEQPLENEADFIRAVKEQRIRIFTRDLC